LSSSLPSLSSLSSPSVSTRSSPSPAHTPTPRRLSTSSSSSASSTPHIDTAYTLPSMSQEAPVVTHHKAAPTLGDGKITPTALNTWEYACKAFFRRKAIAADDQVAEAAEGFLNERVRDWYICNQARLDAMKWADFVSAIRSRFLPQGWDAAMRADLHTTSRRGPKLRRLHPRNREVELPFAGDHIRLSDAEIRSLVSASVDKFLRDGCISPAITTIADYGDWKDAIALLDAQRMQLRRMVHATTSSTRATSSRSTGSTSTASANASSGKRSGLPKLTDKERDLLRAHQGCFTCRQFYAGHISDGCPNGYPKADGYKPLTEAAAAAARAKKENIKPSNPTRKTVAAVTVEDDSDPADTVDPVAVAALGSSPLAATTGILGTGSDSDMCVAPLYAPHTILSAHALSPSVDAPPIQMLIDSGSPAVLIREDVAQRLQLPRRQLREPFRLGNAWGAGSKESSSYVRLRIALPDFSWTSVSCAAIVVPSLCAPVLLGKPFLESNHIVEDHSSRVLLHKPTMRNLLADAPPKPPPPERTRARRATADMHTIAAAVTTATAIRDRVESLAFQASLDSENATMKAEFIDMFPDDIPHIDELPTSVYHRFVLKNANMVIARRQYDCPKKYREAWK
ncbi:hypothetical protein C8Q76DRAFT_832673, partial [Earliella scabrosa]